MSRRTATNMLAFSIRFFDKIRREDREQPTVVSIDIECGKRNLLCVLCKGETLFFHNTTECSVAAHFCPVTTRKISKFCATRYIALTMGRCSKPDTVFCPPLSCADDFSPSQKKGSPMHDGRSFFVQKSLRSLRLLRVAPVITSVHASRRPSAPARAW